jgi:hypothetical protein
MVELDRQWLRQARRAVFEDYRRQAISRWIEARGSSMRPLIRPGAQMLVEFGVSAVHVGDIILFPLGEILVAHRVVARRWRPDSQVLIPKGDGEPYCDPALPTGDIIGVVRALRDGPDGPAVSVGCAGFAAWATARVSRVSGRGASLARRMAARLPESMHRSMVRAIPPIARVTARIVFAPLRWAAAIQAFRLRRSVGA